MLPDSTGAGGISSGRENMKLVISLDVEEEGLFSGRYPRESGVTNVAELRRLEFIPREFGLPADPAGELPGGPGPGGLRSPGPLAGPLPG